MKGLGDLTEKAISIITLGQGKKIAKYVAKLRGKEDCGCNKRQSYLNKLLSFKTNKPSKMKTVTLDWTKQWRDIRNQVSCSCHFDYMLIEIVDINGDFLEEIKVISPPVLKGMVTFMQWGVDLAKHPSYITIKCHKTKGGYTKEVKGIIR